MNNLKLFENNILEKINIFKQLTDKTINNYIQIEISNEYNNTYYDWEFEESIHNIISIKLINYSIPEIRYNISSHNDTLIYFIFNNNDSNDANSNSNSDCDKNNITDIAIQEKIIKIKHGLYDINSLLDYINKINNNDFITKITNDQKIYILLNNNIQFKDTLLLNDTLGINNLKSIDGIIYGDSIYNLRIVNKSYLYLENIADSVFSILTPNAINIKSEFKFDKQITLKNLTIHIKDNHNNTMNYYNMNHYLLFLLEITC